MSSDNAFAIHSVLLQPSGQHFNVLPGQTLLDAALGEGIALPFGCTNGSCGECRAKILSGTIQKTIQQEFTFTAAQKLDGHCLLCANTATSAVELEVLEATSVNDIPVQKLNAKLCKVEQADNVAIATFKFARGKVLRFLPGQSASIVLQNGETALLPISSCPCNAQYVQFHLFPDCQSVSGPAMQTVLKAISNNQKRVTITGPIGQYSLRKSTNPATLFVAQGADFAQLQGMIEQVLSSEAETPCCLVWTPTATVSHYRMNLCRSWHDAFDEFEFVPAASANNIIDQIPVRWLRQLTQCDIYLGKESKSLITQLQSRGADDNNLCYPEPE